MFIVHYVGRGYGLYSAITEYVQLFEDKPTAQELEDATVPGFRLSTVVEVAVISGDESMLPIGQPLVVKY